jgi:hypothetical protein
MTKNLLPILILLFSTQVLAIEFPIEISEYIDDVKIDAFINKEDLENTSQWTPFESSPPLTINQALTAILNDEKSEINLNNASVIGVELKPVPHHKSYWHYLVKIKTISEEGSEPHFFIVLMDGKVIPAIKEPDSIK